VTGRARRLAAFGVGLAVSVVALWVLVSSVDLAATSAALGRAKIEWLVPIAAVLAVQLALRTFRWSRLAASLRPHDPVPAIRFAAPLVIGYLGNAVLPARLGEAVRAAILGRAERLPIASVLGTVLVERIVDTLTLAALAGLVASAVAPNWMARLAVSVAAVAIVGLVVLIVGGRLVATWLRTATTGSLRRAATVAGGAVLNIATAVAGIPRAVLGLAVVLSLAAWLCDAMLFWLVSYALGIGLPLPMAFLVGAVTVLGTAIPSLPGYVGTFEAAAVGAAVALGVAPGDALALAVLAHVCSTIPVASLGAVALVRRGLGRADLAEAAASARGRTRAPASR
jgi:glycosyltransferase 2 family protein